MPFPIAHALVGASVMAASSPRRPLRRDWKLLLWAAALAISPDLDFFFVWVLHLGGSWHRGCTHSLIFALVAGVGAALWLGMARLRAAFACGLAFLSHGLLDYATTRRGGGVELYWPFSPRRLKLGIVGISEFGLKHQALGAELVEIARACLFELLLFAPVLLAILLLRWLLSSALSAEESAS